MIDKKSEYAALRNELVSTINIQINLTTVMYTATFVVLGLAISNSNAFLSLLPYLILFPFQGTINNKRGAMMKIGAYLNVFHEDDGQWESVYPKFNRRWKQVAPKRRIRTRFLTRTSSSQLGVLSSGLAVYFHLANSVNAQYHNIFLDIGFVLIALLPMLFLFLVNRSTFQADNTMTTFKKIMQEIKGELESGNKFADNKAYLPNHSCERDSN
jgi:hypothetical protein